MSVGGAMKSRHDGLAGALDTPAALIDGDRLERNLSEAASLCEGHGVALRPHVKAHKVVEIAQRQRKLGASGLTTAKLGEAEIFADAGFDDIFVCYPIVGEQKLRRLVDLARRARVSTIVEHIESLAALECAAEALPERLDVLIKLDVGMHRVGVAPADAGGFADRLSHSRSLKLKGVCIHEGTTYTERDPVARRSVARAQVELLVATAQDLREAGFAIETVSSGATPAFREVLDIPGLTEVRPGNYVFNDGIQVGLGVVDQNRCALTVLATVVGHAASDRAIIDAGSKALSLDRGAHGTSVVTGFGQVQGRPGADLFSLSEEHGWMRLDGAASVGLGEQLEVIPNHACVVVDNFEAVNVVRGRNVVARWPVAARGRMT